MVIHFSEKAMTPFTCIPGGIKFLTDACQQTFLDPLIPLQFQGSELGKIM